MNRLLTLLAVLGASSEASEAPQAEPASLSWKLLGNNSPSDGLCRAELVLTLVDGFVVPDDGGSLYFNFGRKPANRSDPEADWEVEHVNGDLFRLIFQSSAVSDGVLRVRIVSKGAVLSRTDAPSGYYLVTGSPDGSQRVTPVAATTDISVLRRERHSASITLPASAERARDDLIAGSGVSAPFIPQPVSYEPLSGVVDLNALPIVCEDGHTLAANLLSNALTKLGCESPVRREEINSERPAIRLGLGVVRVVGTDEAANEEAYRLEAHPKSGIRITGSDSAGLFYGVQTLIALIENAAVPAQQGVGPTLPAAVIGDSPHFRYRGLHLDVARNFHGPETIRKLLDLMAAYKLNRFHLHLTDDEGWRLAIRELPELTSVGGRRGHSPEHRDYLLPSFGSGPEPSAAPGSGHYSRNEFVELLRYAAERHIEVIPEIDLPGHARAAICSMQARYERLLKERDTASAKRFLLRRPDDDSQYESVQMWDDNVVDVRLDSTVAFVEHVVGDLASMYQEAGIGLSTVHFGGDEVPSGCWGPGAESGVQELFVTFMDRCAEIARSHGARSAGWEEVFLDSHRDSKGPSGAASEGLCYTWNNIWGWGQEDAAYRLANAGAEVVLCGATHLYFDLAYQSDAEEPGYYWAGTTDTEEVFRFRPYTYFKGTVLDRDGERVSDSEKQLKTALTDKGRGHIVGLQGHLWGENLNSANRLEYMAFPRVLALAERAWVGPPCTTDRRSAPRSWKQFASHLGRYELPRLDRAFGGVRYRVPSVRVVKRESRLAATPEFPGMAIRYTTDGLEPSKTSELYTAGLPANASYRFRAFDSRGRGGPVTHWSPAPTADRSD